MALRSIAQLKAWFKRGKYPTETQFSDWMDSYWHKEEKIPVISVDQLPEQLNEKYPKADGVQLAERTTKVEQELTQHEQYADEKFGTIYDRLEELDELKVDKAVIGKPDGVAALDGEGKVPADQLPSYVDDVLEGTLSDAATFLDPNGAAYSPETGKIYVDTTSNREYRWAGAQYEILSKSLELGESSSTAFRGDYGRIAYDHSLMTEGNPHGTAFADLLEKESVWTTENFDPDVKFSVKQDEYIRDVSIDDLPSEGVYTVFGISGAPTGGWYHVIALPYINSNEKQWRAKILTALGANDSETAGNMYLMFQNGETWSTVKFWNGVNFDPGVAHRWYGTQAEYDALPAATKSDAGYEFNIYEA